MSLIKENVSLKDYSNFKIGGPARYFLESKSLDELKAGLAEWQRIKSADATVSGKIFIISGATNILFDDAGFDGLILKNSISYIEKNGNDMSEVGAGTSIKELNEYCIDNSISGMEWSGGLPGSVGGAVFGNAGAFGGEMKDSVVGVDSFDLNSGQIIKRNNLQCQFSYRQSIFKSEKLPEIIISAEIQLKAGDRAEITGLIQDKIDYRVRKQPLEYPNIGSIFKNVDLKLASPELVEKVREKIKNDPFPVIPTAYLISLAGLKGKQIGGAQISEKHPNMFINRGEAKASEVKELMNITEDSIFEKFGVHLEPEVRQLGQQG